MTAVRHREIKQEKAKEEKKEGRKSDSAFLPPRTPPLPSIRPIYVPHWIGMRRGSQIPTPNSRTFENGRRLLIITPPGLSREERVLRIRDGMTEEAATKRYIVAVYPNSIYVRGCVGSIAAL